MIALQSAKASLLRMFHVGIMTTSLTPHYSITVLYHLRLNARGVGGLPGTKV
jgi:hypothetical protein